MSRYIYSQICNDRQFEHTCCWMLPGYVSSRTVHQHTWCILDLRWGRWRRFIGRVLIWKHRMKPSLHALQLVWPRGTVQRFTKPIRAQHKLLLTERNVVGWYWGWLFASGWWRRCCCCCWRWCLGLLFSYDIILQCAETERLAAVKQRCDLVNERWRLFQICLRLVSHPAEARAKCCIKQYTGMSRQSGPYWAGILMERALWPAQKAPMSLSELLAPRLASCSCTEYGLHQIVYMYLWGIVTCSTPKGRPTEENWYMSRRGVCGVSNNVSVRLHQILIIFNTRKHILWVKASQKEFIQFWKQVGSFTPKLFNILFFR